MYIINVKMASVAITIFGGIGIGLGFVSSSTLSLLSQIIYHTPHKYKILHLTYTGFLLYNYRKHITTIPYILDNSINRIELETSHKYELPIVTFLVFGSAIGTFIGIRLSYGVINNIIICK